ncbi:hypothetical protein GHT09_007004 [Marmota monax]|uniref:Uncharacterized protein n=1 Tax=Marmota monax TaxID=9995 RepID=A0A834PQ28_MARMO|nr:hypothetical protein GHT09_007004 [Marmota monax]
MCPARGHSHDRGVLGEGRGSGDAGQAGRATQPQWPHGVPRYIQNPLLLDGKKFDVRSYLLIACAVPYMVFFGHGYARLTLSLYDPHSRDLSGHLTNQFMQKKSPLYVLLKEDTVWSMDHLNSYINDKFRKTKGLPRDWVFTTFTKRMQQIMAHCFLAVKSKLQCKLGYFDLIGCDFLIDENFKVWLLEMNSNPALHTNCEVLKEVIPGVVMETLGEPQHPDPTARWKGPSPCLPSTVLYPALSQVQIPQISSPAGPNPASRPNLPTKVVPLHLTPSWVPPFEAPSPPLPPEPQASSGEAGPPFHPRQSPTLPTPPPDLALETFQKSLRSQGMMPLLSQRRFVLLHNGEADLGPRLGGSRTFPRRPPPPRPVCEAASSAPPAPPAPRAADRPGARRPAPPRGAPPRPLSAPRRPRPPGIGAGAAGTQGEETAAPGPERPRVDGRDPAREPSPEPPEEERQERGSTSAPAPRGPRARPRPLGTYKGYFVTNAASTEGLGGRRPGPRADPPGRPASFPLPTNPDSTAVLRARWGLREGGVPGLASLMAQPTGS